MGREIQGSIRTAARQDIIKQCKRTAWANLASFVAYGRTRFP